MSDKPPSIPLELRLQLRVHALEVQVCKLTFANAELQLKVADKEAAIESDRLTMERDNLAAALNTPEWRYDFDEGRFVSRAQPAAPAGPKRLTVEAKVVNGLMTFETDIRDVPVGKPVRVRVRYPATADYASEIEPLVTASVAHLRPEDVEIGRVPVTDLEA